MVPCVIFFACNFSLKLPCDVCQHKKRQLHLTGWNITLILVDEIEWKIMTDLRCSIWAINKVLLCNHGFLISSWCVLKLMAEFSCDYWAMVALTPETKCMTAERNTCSVEVWALYTVMFEAFSNEALCDYKASFLMGNIPILSTWVMCCFPQVVGSHYYK